MSFNDEWTRGVVLIIDNRNDRDRPVGTGFIVTRGPKETAQGFLVTAEHVVRGLPEGETLIRFRDASLKLHAATIRGSWGFPFDGMDLAVMPFTSRQSLGLYAYRMEHTTEAIGFEPGLGTTVETIGLLDDVPMMARYAIPFVRTATIGAKDIPGVSYGAGGQWKTTAHLLDSRSNLGASGSPVFALAPHVDLAAPPPAFPVGYHEDPSSLRPVLRFKALFGMLLAHGKTAEIGIVLPVEFIRQGIERIASEVEQRQ